MPPLSVLDFVEPTALAGAGQDDGGPVRAGRVGQGRLDLTEVVAIDGNGPAAEPLDPAGVRLQVPAQLRRAPLTQPVDVDNGGQVVQPVVGGLVERLPHGALSHLTVATQHPHSERELVEIPAGQSHSHAIGQPLTERAGRHIHPGQQRGRMALQARTELPVPGHQLLVRDDTCSLEHRVQQRRGVTLGKDQMVVGRLIGAVPVVAEMASQEDRHHVGRGHARRRMTGPGGGAAADRVHPQLLSQLPDVYRGLIGHGFSFPAKVVPSVPSSSRGTCRPGRCGDPPVYYG